MQEKALLRTPEEVRELLRELLAEMEVEVQRELEMEGVWTFYLNCWGYPVILEGNRSTHYCVVFFHIMLPEDRVRRSLNELYEKKDLKFLYELTRAFTSPLTAFSRITSQEGEVIGYRVSKNLYPYHQGFTIRELDGVLQAVVSSGIAGAAYLRSVMGEFRIQYRLEAEFGKATPGPMFG